MSGISWSKPPPPPGFRDSLVRKRVLVNLKPRGDLSFEGAAMAVEPDGYLLSGSAGAPLVAFEQGENAETARAEMPASSTIWIDRGDVLFVEILS